MIFKLSGVWVEGVVCDGLAMGREVGMTDVLHHETVREIGRFRTIADEVLERREFSFVVRDAIAISRGTPEETKIRVEIRHC